MCVFSSHKLFNGVENKKYQIKETQNKSGKNERREKNEGDIYCELSHEQAYI